MPEAQKKSTAFFTLNDGLILDERRDSWLYPFEIPPYRLVLLCNKKINTGIPRRTTREQFFWINLLKRKPVLIAD
jgi:hypothetical protein